MARTAKNTVVKDIVVDEANGADVTVATPVKKKAAKTYSANDLIACRSITEGELILPGKKSGILYRWSAFGDITEVEYQDLYSLKASRSRYLMEPFIVIEDEELVEQWDEIKKVYGSMYGARDVMAIINLPNTQFEKTFSSIPIGLQNAVKARVATMIDEGTFDSINKVRVIDKVCGTDFMFLLK